VPHWSSPASSIVRAAARCWDQVSRIGAAPCERVLAGKTEAVMAKTADGAWGLTNSHANSVATATEPLEQIDTLAPSHRRNPMAAIELSFSQTFELERMRREIEATQDPAHLRALSKELLQAWFSEKASTQQAIREQLGHG